MACINAAAFSGINLNLTFALQVSGAGRVTPSSQEVMK